MSGLDYELKHTWEINKKAWYIRLFIFVWFGAKETELTFCKLFWGYVFLPLGLILDLAFLIVIGVIFPFILIAEKIEDKKEAAKEARLHAPPAPPKEPATPNRVLVAIENFFSKLAMGIGSVWFKTQRIRKWIVSGAVVLGALLGVALGAFLIYLVVTADVAWLKVFTIVGIVIAAVLCIAALGWVLAQLWGKWKKHQATKPPKERKSPRFFTVLVQGYIAVKTNTCPRIVLKD